MGGITTGIGLASGIDSGTLIQRLLSIEARPRTLAQQRMVQLQQQQAAYFDLNSRLNTLKSAAAKFRTGRVFDTMRASSSEPTTLNASASTSAQAGSYKLLVDRLVTSQQFLSKGFADKSTSALGASSFTFESAVARLDRDTNLAELNGGEGINRGKIVITTSSGSTTVDLSKAATVNEVLEAINGSGAGVTATVEGGRFVVAGATLQSISNATGSETATSLGIAKSAVSGEVEGDVVYALSADTALSSLNDGNGVDIGDDRAQSPQKPKDFTLTVGSETVSLYLGAIWGPDPADPNKLVVQTPAVSTLGQAVERINEQIDAQLAGDPPSVQVQINAAGTALEVVNTSGASVTFADPSGRATASDLGIAGSFAAGTGSGTRILAGLNSTLLKTINGGSGIGVNGSGLGELAITNRLGASQTVTFAADASIDDVIRAVNESGLAGISASLNAEGTGILLTDSNASPTSNLIIQGASAASLGLDTGASGVAASSKDSESLEHAYVTRATLVSALNGGQGIGTGKFRITGSSGATVTIDIGQDTRTVADLVREIDSFVDDIGLRARVNDGGDGIVIEEIAVPPGSQKIKIEDISGGVAKALRIAGEAEGTGAENFIDGSYETTIEFEAEDTLEDVVRKLNESGAGVAASILSSGSSSKPYRISLTSRESGTAGRLILDTNGFDLGLETLEAGQDARVFLGSTDPAKAILLTSSTNTLDQVISGVSIDLLTASEDPVELTIARDTSAFESAVNEFVTAFNAVIQRIDQQSTYDEATKRKGIFLGDGTAQGIRQNLFSSILDDGENLSGTFTRLTNVGIKFGDGQLTFDREKFRTALEEDFAAVKDIFAAREQDPNGGQQQIAPGVFVRVPVSEQGFTKLGVVAALEETIKDYVDTIDGSLTRRTDSLSDQIRLQQDRIDFLGEKLNVRRGVLERQFVAMEQAIAALQNQGSALSQIQAIG